MENFSSGKRLFRSKPAILELLKQQKESGLSIQAFCAQYSIPSGSFHNWKKKYGDTGSPAFTSVQISPSAILFAEVNGIKLYQPVSADYLKELAS